MLSDALEKIKLHKNFYRDCYLRALNFLLSNFSLIIILLLIIIFLALTRPEPSYYTTSSSGIITPLHALSEPNYSHTPLIQ
jgi:intracellular multiplication protein IcmL